MLSRINRSIGHHFKHSVYMLLCLPPSNGETYCFKLRCLSVRLSVLLSVCLTVCHAFVSTYLLNPWWDLQITLHKCQVWWDHVQCLCLTKVSSRSRSQSKIKHCMTVFHVRSISFEPLVGFTNNFAQMSSMMRRCAVPMFDQVGSRSRSQSKIKHCMTVFCVCSISFEPLVRFINNLAEMSSMIRQCAVHMFHQGQFRFKVIVQG